MLVFFRNKPRYWNIHVCHDNVKWSGWILEIYAVLQKIISGGGNHPPPPQQVGSHVSLRLLRYVRYSDFVRLCDLTGKLFGYLRKKVPVWQCNPLIVFAYQHKSCVKFWSYLSAAIYILLGINDIYEDLWKEYLSQKWLMKLSLLIGVMNCFSPLYSTVCHIIP